jgi:uncharacterized protein (DUF983 family)
MRLDRARRVLGRALRHRCPRCGGAPVFERLFRMRERCAVCGLAFEREPGYFVGAIYLNYAVTVLILMPACLLLAGWWEVGLRARLIGGLGFATLFPLWFFRYSKSLWLGLDHLVDPGTEPAEGPTARRPRGQAGGAR